jgi:hypothetical protein
MLIEVDLALAEEVPDTREAQASQELGYPLGPLGPDEYVDIIHFLVTDIAVNHRAEQRSLEEHDFEPFGFSRGENLRELLRALFAPAPDPGGLGQPGFRASLK